MTSIASKAKADKDKIPVDMKYLVNQTFKRSTVPSVITFGKYDLPHLRW